MDISFLSPEAFIQTAHKMYALDSLDPNTNCELLALISTTKLSHNTMVHVLYYLHLLLTHRTYLYHHPATQGHSQSRQLGFNTSCREKLLPAPHRRTSADLFELLIVLMMVANKANDDSSYTMKTWENLTPLSISVLRKRELIVLKKLNYNVFLKTEDHAKWCTQVYAMVRGALPDVHHQDVSQQGQPKETYPLQAGPFNTTPLYNAVSSLSPLDSLPLTPRSPSLDLLLYAHAPVASLPKRKLYDGNAEQRCAKRSCYNKANDNNNSYGVVTDLTFTQTLTAPSISLPLPAFPYEQQQQLNQQQYQYHHQNQLLTPLKRFDYEYELQEHPQDCSCCALTRMTDVYHNNLRNGLKL